MTLPLQYFIIADILQNTQAAFYKLTPIPSLHPFYEVIYDKSIIDYQVLIKHSNNFIKQQSYLVLLITRLEILISEKLGLKHPLENNLLLDIFNNFHYDIY
jgi:hypothetical protein